MPARRAERPSLAISSDVRRAPRAPRASALATMTTKLARSSTGMVSTPTRAPQSTIARSPLATARSSTRAMPRSSIRSACSGRAGAGSTRHASPCASPAASSAGATTGPQAIRRSASGTATCAAATSAASPVASARSSTKARSSRGSERHRAGRRAHAAAGADQRDVTLVTQSGRRAARVERARCGQSLTQARSVDRPFDDPDRTTVERLSRSAHGAFRCDQEDARLGAPRTLAAHEVAGCCTRGVGGQQHVGIGRVSRRQQGDLGQAGERVAKLLGQRGVASEQGQADDHESSPRKSRRTSRPLRAGRQGKCDRGRRAQRHGDATRALAGRRKQLETARGDSRAVGPQRSRRRRISRVAAAACRGPIRRPGRVRPHARRAGATRARHSRAAHRASESRRLPGR